MLRVETFEIFEILDDTYTLGTHVIEIFDVENSSGLLITVDMLIKFALTNSPWTLLLLLRGRGFHFFLHTQK
jgi:hypothetical protein